MIRVEIWPHGDNSRARVLGQATISNDGTGTKGVGNYKVTLWRQKAGVWRSGVVTKFPRLRLGIWDLLYRALRATVEDRNERKTK